MWIPVRNLHGLNYERCSVYKVEIEEKKIKLQTGCRLGRIQEGKLQDLDRGKWGGVISAIFLSAPIVPFSSRFSFFVSSSWSGQQKLGECPLRPPESATRCSSIGSIWTEKLLKNSDNNFIENSVSFVCVLDERLKNFANNLLYFAIQFTKNI